TSMLNLLLAPLTAPLDGIVWIAQQIQERAEAELDNAENLHKRLLALQLAVDMGEISEEEFEAQEEMLLLAIQELEEQQRQAAENDDGQY
ncbi:MAG: gas vesicle protein GvpG, partial [Leptodesmis sp.]|uniref:gas vesicle protein GvpG n=2 Tax=Leptodesmis TaxID=2664261 RepID=UPI003D0F93D7